MALILSAALVLGAMSSDGAPVQPDMEAVGTEVVDAPSEPAYGGIYITVHCIEMKESGGANIWNHQGSGAGGVMQYMAGTFTRGAREMGHPEWSLWNPDQARTVAAHDLLMGRRSQWTVRGC